MIHSVSLIFSRGNILNDWHLVEGPLCLSDKPGKSKLDPSLSVTGDGNDGSLSSF